MRVNFHSEAQSEFDRAQAWYEERSMVAASAFLHEVSAAVQRIRESPLRFPRAEHDTRRVNLERFPFTIFYKVLPEEIIIIAVAHQKRRPGYWAAR